MNKLIIVFTRMYATRCGGEDEFILWYPPKNGCQEHEFVVFRSPEDDRILVLHGYYERYQHLNKDTERYCDLMRYQVEEAMDSATDVSRTDACDTLSSSKPEVIVAIHSGPKMKSIVDLAAEGRLGFHPKGTVRVTSSKKKYKKYKELAKRIRDAALETRDGAEGGGHTWPVSNGLFGGLRKFFLSEEHFSAERQEASLVDIMTALKHRAVNVFLPLDFDLQGLNDNPADKKLAKEILTAYGEDHHLLRDLADLQFILSGESKLQVENVSVRPSIRKEQMPKLPDDNGRAFLRDCISDDVVSSVEEGEVPGLEFLGLDEQFSFREDARIVKFIHQLDCAIAEAKSKDSEAVDVFLEKFGDVLKECKDFSFNTWLSSLNEWMYALREEVAERGTNATARVK